MCPADDFCCSAMFARRFQPLFLKLGKHTSHSLSEDTMEKGSLAAVAAPSTPARKTSSCRPETPVHLFYGIFAKRLCAFEAMHGKNSKKMGGEAGAHCAFSFAPHDSPLGAGSQLNLAQKCLLTTSWKLFLTMMGQEGKKRHKKIKVCFQAEVNG